MGIFARNIIKSRFAGIKQICVSDPRTCMAGPDQSDPVLRMYERPEHQLDLGAHDIKGNIIQAAVDDDVRPRFCRLHIHVMHRFDCRQILGHNVVQVSSSLPASLS